MSDFKYPVGGLVEPVHAKGIEAIVLSRMEGPATAISYNIAFWHEATRHTEWLYEHELQYPRINPGMGVDK